VCKPRSPASQRWLYRSPKKPSLASQLRHTDPGKRGIPGVSDVAVDGRTIRVSVDEATAKVDVIDRIRDDGAVILDVTIEESSLEDLFSAYTSDAPPEVDTSEVER